MNNIVIDAGKSGEHYKAIWKKLITAGRVQEGLRDEWREQLRDMQKGNRLRMYTASWAF